MSIALAEQHQELARVARAFLESSRAREESRALLEAPEDRLPSFWKKMAELGWMGLHVDEVYGGQGFGLPELSVILEALGFAMAPGSFLPTTLTAELIAQQGSDVVREAFLPGLADGSAFADWTDGVVDPPDWQDAAQARPRAGRSGSAGVSRAGRHRSGAARFLDRVRAVAACRGGWMEARRAHRPL